MSYCVNCGVELDASAKKCVLCNTPVYNPAKPVEKNIPTPFSEKPMIPATVKNKFVALIISYIILIPNIVCVFINLFTSPENLWFVFVASTSLLLWVVFVFPFFTKKLHPYIMWAFDTVAVALYTFVFHAQNFGGDKWYFGIALPIIGIVSLAVLCFIYWDWTSKVLHLFIDFFVCLGVAALCFFLNDHLVKAEVCLVACVCCLALVFFWLYANKSRKLRAWLANKVFV